MLAQSVDGQAVHILELLLDVVGVKRSERADHLDVLSTERKDVAIGTQHHAEIAEERTDRTERFLKVATFHAERILAVEHHTRCRQELLESFAHADRTTTGTAAAVRCGERLVQVDVHHVESHITGTAYAEHRVEVGSVVVHQSAAFMHELLDFGYLLLEETQRVGVGHHHCTDLVAKLCLEVFHIDGTVAERLHLHHIESADSSRRGIGSVG